MNVQKLSRKNNAALASAGFLVFVSFSQYTTPVWAQSKLNINSVDTFSSSGSTVSGMTSQQMNSTFGSSNSTVGQITKAQLPPPTATGPSSSPPPSQASLGGSQISQSGQSLDAAADRIYRNDFEIPLNRLTALRLSSPKEETDPAMDRMSTQIVMPHQNANMREVMNGQLYSNFNNQLMDTKMVITNGALAMTEPAS